MTADSNGADLALTVLAYIFLATMLIVCVAAAVLLMRWLRPGPVRTFGTSGFAILALQAVMATGRNIMLDVARANDTYNSISITTVNLIDFLSALIRLVGIGMLAVALLSVGRDLRAMMSGRSQPAPAQAQYQPTPGTQYPGSQVGGTQYPGSQVGGTQYDTDQTNYAPRPIPSAPQPTPGTIPPQPFGTQAPPPPQQPPTGWNPQG